jgi:hypothetical protein
MTTAWPHGRANNGLGVACVSEYVVDDREMPRFRVNREVMVDPGMFAKERDEIF